MCISRYIIQYVVRLPLVTCIHTLLAIPIYLRHVNLLKLWQSGFFLIKELAHFRKISKCMRSLYDIGNN